MAIRGVLCAISKNMKPDIVDTETLMKWYDEIHIPEVIATSGINTAVRYDALSPNAQMQCLVAYPVDDIGFVETPEFNSISKGGHEEIKGWEFPDLAKIDLRIGAEIDRFEPDGTKPGFATCLVLVTIGPGDGLEDEFNSWYREEYYQSLSKLYGFRRVIRYRVDSAIGRQDCPKYFAFHEFDTVDLPLTDFVKTRETPRAAKIFREAKCVEDWPFKLVKAAESSR